MTPTPKVKLGARPKSFARTLSVMLPGVGMAAIGVTYTYRTRTEFGAFIDGMAAAERDRLQSATATPAAVDAAAPSSTLRDIYAKGSAASAEYLMQIITGWDLDEPFSAAAVAQLCDELPGVAAAIVDDYRLAVTEGRLGN